MNSRNDLTHFNEGGSHQQNPLGGIPMGQGQSVEQGETKKNDFVYSDRITLSKDIIGNFNLPKSLIGKTVAEATKLIDKKFDGRNDKISTSTKNGMLDRIAQAQESMKPQEPMNNEQMFLGGFTGNSGTSGNGQSLDSEYMKRYDYDPKLKEQINQTEGIKDTIGSAIPIAGLFRQGEKAGKGLGQAVGGDDGGDIAGGILDPLSGQMETLKNGKSTQFEKGLSLAAPFLSGILASKGRDRIRQEALNKNHIMSSSQGISDFAYGGPLSKNDYLMSLDDKDAIEALKRQDAPFNYNPNSTFPNGDYQAPTVESTAFNWKGLSEKVGKYGGKAGNILGSAARYAPVAMNALQLSKLKKPEYERLNRLNNRFNPDYVDERSLQNIAGNEYDNTVNAITQMGGSEGATRNAILAAGLNKTKAIGQAYMEESNQNRNQKLQGQQFNLGVDQANIGQSNLELDINDRNAGAYETQKSKLLSQLGTDVGEIGKEETYKDIVKKTFGYTWNGKYWLTPTGETKTDDQVTQELASKSQKKLGGYLMKKYK